MTTVRASVITLATSLVLCLAATGTAAATWVPDGDDGPLAVAPASPHVDGTRTIPVYDYANAIRESVYVDTTMDTDSDGRDDVVAVDIVRPRETELTGL
jgi:X-Pro dipeptidyl-peptidase